MVVLDNQKIRQKIRKQRQQLKAAVYAQYSQQCFENLLTWPLFQESSMIGLYCSVSNEVDTWPIIQFLLNSNKRVALPRILSKTKMAFYEIKSLNDLEKDAYDIYAPKKACPVVLKMDLLLVPLVAYQSNGYRLGMGKGYYDRYLSKWHQTTCGLAFSFQKQDFKTYPHDQRLDYLINEKQRLTF